MKTNKPTLTDPAGGADIGYGVATADRQVQRMARVFRRATRRQKSLLSDMPEAMNDAHRRKGR